MTTGRDRTRLLATAGAVAVAACSPAPPAGEPPRPAPPAVADAGPVDAAPPPAIAPDAGAAAAPLPAEPGPRIAALQARLAAVPDFTGTEVPAPARPILADLKRASRDLAAELARADLLHTPVEEVDRAVSDAARDAQIRYGAEGSSDTSPGTWSTSITRSKQNPRYLVAGYYFEIPCGNDAGYLVYDLGAARGPKLLLALGSPDYDSIAGAFWQLAFAMPPPGAPDAFFFTASRIEPWCTSALRRLQLLVLRPGPTPDEPIVLVDETVPLHLLGGYSIDVAAKEVKLSFTPRDPTNKDKRRWAIDKTGAKRLPP